MQKATWPRLVRDTVTGVEGLLIPMPVVGELMFVPYASNEPAELIIWTRASISTRHILTFRNGRVVRKFRELPPKKRK